MAWKWNDLVAFTVKKLFGYQTAEKIRENLYYLRDEMTDLMKGLRIKSSGETVISISADVITVEGIKFINLNLTLDISNIGANGRDTGTLDAGDIWYIFIITDDTGSIVAGLASKSSSSPTLPSGYTKKRLISFCKLDSTPAILPFSQIGRDYTYWFYQTLFTSVTLPAGYNNAYAYSVLSYAPVDICEQVEICLKAFGTSSSVMDAVCMGQNKQEWYQSDGIRDEGYDNDFVWLRGWVAVDPEVPNIEFWSLNGNNVCYGYVKGVKLKM